MISFLDLVPAKRRATVVVESEGGSAEFELFGVSLTHLAEIGKRYPGFARVIEGGAGLLSATEAMPSLIAAGLGHAGEADYERHAGKLPSDLVIALASEIVKLTFPERPSLALVAEPEVEAPAHQSGNGMLPGQTSPVRLNS